MSFNLDLYFERIGWRPSGESALEALRQVHMRHLMNIPFENLDVYAKKDISLDPDAVFNKLVVCKRGGYCFEMNELIYQAAAAMGYEVTPYLSRISLAAYGGTGYGGFTHRVNIVKLDGKRYMLDVGYGGDCFQFPVLLEEGVEQKQLFNTYRVAPPSGGVDIVVQCMRGDGVFADLLGVVDKPAVQQDFEIGNFYTSKSPTSFFASNIMCVLLNEKGKNTLFNNRLTIIENGEACFEQVEKENLVNVLKERFNLDAEGLI